MKWHVILDTYFNQIGITKVFILRQYWFKKCEMMRKVSVKMLELLRAFARPWCWGWTTHLTKCLNSPLNFLSFATSSLMTYSSFLIAAFICASVMLRWTTYLTAVSEKGWPLMVHVLDLPRARASSSVTLMQIKWVSNKKSLHTKPLSVFKRLEAVNWNITVTMHFERIFLKSVI